MAVETVFLGILVFSLIIGHFFLEITKPKKRSGGKISPETQKLLMPSETLSGSGISAINERLARLEKILLSANTPMPQTNPAGNGLQKKLQSLVDFRNEIRIEVAALKEQVKEIKEFAGMKEEQKQSIAEINDGRLHELVYNVRTKSK